MSRPVKGIQFDLTPGYIFKNNVGSGGFGHVCAAFDTQKVLQHKYDGDGVRSTFKVQFKHLKPEDAKFVRVLVNNKAARFSMKLPPNDVWPLIVEVEGPPPAKGVSVVIQSNELVAIKRVTEVFTDLQHSKYTLRELKLLKFFNHDNIIGLRDSFLPPHAGANWSDLYIVNDLMDNNLRQVVKSDQPISKYHASYFMYQIFCGLKAMHDADIIHRDLKPHNVLVNQDCTIKICDFGMARKETGGEMTEEVQTIWYRAPEVLMDCDHYSKPIDMWACGTILGELLVRKALFMGKHARHMLQLIVQLLGTMGPDDVDFETSQKTKKFVLEQRAKQIDWKRWAPGADHLALDLISNLLPFNPNRRFTIEEALNHPFSQIWVECEEEGTGIPDPLHKLNIPNPSPQRQQLTQLAEDIVAVIAKQQEILANPAPLVPLFKQLTQLMPDVALLLQARWGFAGDTFMQPILERHIPYIKHFARSLHAKPLPGETVKFEAGFEAQFARIPPNMEEQAMQKAAELIKIEVADFQKHNKVTSALGGPTNAITQTSAAPLTVDVSGNDNEVTLVELSGVPSTPVAPVSGTAWEDVHP